jgi:hypothetical protein
MDTTAQEKDYTRKTTSECINYIESFERSLSVADSLSIPGLGGLIYKLPNDKIVLIPTNYEIEYSGFIFSSLSAFNEMVEKDYYPVAENELTSWEVEKFNLENLPFSTVKYKQFLEKNLKIDNVDISNDTQLRIIYDVIVRFLKIKKSVQIIKERMVLSFAIVIMDHLVKLYSGKWKYQKRYEVYNSYNYPLIEIQNKTKNTINDLYILFEGKAADFIFFKKFIGLE